MPPNDFYHVGDEACFNEVKRRLGGINGIRILEFREAIPNCLQSSLWLKQVLNDGFVPQPLASAIENCDVVWLVGGGNLTSLFPQYLYHRLAIVAAGRIMRKIVIATGQTLGPFDREDLKIFRTVVRLFSFLGLRDRADSVAEAISAGCHGIVTHDDAYFLPYEASSMSGAGQFSVGLAMRDWDGLAAVDRCRRLLSSLSTPYVLRLIPHIVSRSNELDTAFMSRHFVGEAYEYSYLTRRGTIDREVKALTATLDCLITTRYHGGVFAASLGIPCLGIYSGEYYKRKLTGLGSLGYPCVLIKGVAEPVTTAETDWLMRRRGTPDVADALDLCQVLRCASGDSRPFTIDDAGILGLF